MNLTAYETAIPVPHNVPLALEPDRGCEEGTVRDDRVIFSLFSRGIHSCFPQGQNEIFLQRPPKKMGVEGLLFDGDNRGHETQMTELLQ